MEAAIFVSLDTTEDRSGRAVGRAALNAAREGTEGHFVRGSDPLITGRALKPVSSCRSFPTETGGRKGGSRVERLVRRRGGPVYVLPDRRSAYIRTPHTRIGCVVDN